MLTAEETPVRADQPTPSRRSLFGGAAVLLAGAALPGIAKAAPNADAELIARCHQFAESHLDRWYRYTAAPDAVAEAMEEEMVTAEDWDSYHRIVETTATTPEGWHAKALAYVAWDCEVFIEKTDGWSSPEDLMISLLRDITTPARDAIIARCTAAYGPLPSEYTKNGIWTGHSQESRATMAAEREAREAADAAAAAERERLTNIDMMTRDELLSALRSMDYFHEMTHQRRNVIFTRLVEMSA